MKMTPMMNIISGTNQNISPPVILSQQNVSSTAIQQSKNIQQEDATQNINFKQELTFQQFDQISNELKQSMQSHDRKMFIQNHSSLDIQSSQVSKLKIDSAPLLPTNNSIDTSNNHKILTTTTLSPSISTMLPHSPAFTSSSLPGDLSSSIPVLAEVYSLNSNSLTSRVKSPASPVIILSSENNSLCPNPKLIGLSSLAGKTNEGNESKIEVKPIPVKKTWRRPWKRKKEREKKVVVKKCRKIKRRKILAPKKPVVRIDPRNGPPIDTLHQLVCRESEDNIDQLKQKRQRIKLNRNSGREYINRLGKVVTARKIGVPCNCPLKCWDRMGSKVIDIFNNFWDLSDFNLQNSYLFTCLKLCDVKRRYTKKPAEESRRQNTFEYFVRISGKHIRVCKKGFMSSHGLTSDKRLRTLFTQMKDGALVPEPDKRGKHLRPVTKGMETQHPSQNNVYHHNTNNHSNKSKKSSRVMRKKDARNEVPKQTMYTPPQVVQLHHCTPPPPPTHAAAMQEPPHAYIPNGEIYFPAHYLEPHQSMIPPHMNQMSCQKMLEAPAYFMADMKENTFHQ